MLLTRKCSPFWAEVGRSDPKDDISSMTLVMTQECWAVM